MRISTSMMFERSTNAMLEQQSKMSKTQLQLATGQRVLSPSDDPPAAARVLDLKKTIATVHQFQRNADRIQDRLALEETTLAGTTDLLQRVRELAVQGSNGSLNASDRSAIAGEIRQLQEELESLANTKDSTGEYLFAGFKTQTQPFSHTGATYSYNGDQGQRALQIAAGRQMADGDNGYDVFFNIDISTGGKRNAFETLEQLASALESNTASSVYIDDIQLVMDNTSRIRTSVGARLNAIDDQTAINEDILLTLETARSKEQDVDYAEAISRFEQELLALQAAQQSYAKIQSLSLFNFL